MTKRNTNVCKGIAIILMYIHHLFYSLETFQGYEINFYPFTGDRIICMALACKICVAIFVFLTAYGTAKQYMIKSINSKQQIQEYTISKYMKLMMGYWVIFLLSHCLSFLGRSSIEAYGESLVPRIIYYGIDFLGLATIIGTPTFNPTWWYMSYAIFLIFFIPLVIKFINQVGEIIVIPLSVLLPMFMGLNMSNVFCWYMLSVVLGVVFAQNNLFENIESLMSKSLFCKIVSIIISIFIFGLLIIFRQKFGYLWFADALLSIIVCYICNIFISKIMIVNSVLEFIGIHSMNLFMLHTFIFAYFFKDFIYSWKYPILILLVLLITTLCVSVAIEQLKKIIHFSSLVEMTTQKMIMLVSKK